MKTFTSLIFLTIFCVLGNQIQSQVSVTGHVFAEVVESLTAAETSPLNFGRFAPQSQGGSIVVSPTGSRTSTGTIALGNGNNNAGSFFITGEQDATFVVSLPTQPINLVNSQNSGVMVVSNWNSTLSEGYGVLENGVKTVNIGATLTAGNLASNPVGLYSGTYTITFDYN